MTRILFLSHDTSLYGANRSLLGLVCGLDRKRFQSLVLTPKHGDFTSSLESQGIETAVFPFKRSHHEIKMEKRFRWGPGRYRAVKGMRRQHCESQRAVLEQILSFARSWKPDLIYTNTRILTIGYDLAEKLHLPHIWHMREFGREDFGLIPIEGTRIFSRKVNQSDAVIAISHAVAKILPKRAKVSVIYNGVMTKREILDYSTRIDADECDECKRFVLVGRLAANKGQSIALRALAQVFASGRDVTLDLVGDGKDDTLVQLADSLGVTEHVNFHGFVAEAVEILEKADVALMCSPHEAMGRVTAEAMCVGTPVIGYKGGATPELIDHEENGLLFDGTPDGLAEAMIRLIDAPSLTKRLGHNALQHALELFTIEAYVSEVCSVIDRVISDGSAISRSYPH